MFRQNDMDVIGLAIICAIALAVLAGAILIISLTVIFKSKSRTTNVTATEPEREKNTLWKCTSCGGDNHSGKVCKYYGSGRQSNKNGDTTQERSVFEQVFGSSFKQNSSVI